MKGMGRVLTANLEPCVFCELVAGKLPISVVDETENVLALMDIQPINPGHVLIIPKLHAPYLADLDPTLGGHILGRRYSRMPIHKDGPAAGVA
jgi:galactose-1-phosphate uridylyltransferase